MNKKEIIRKIIKDNNGILLSKNLSDNDISLQYISEMVKDGEIFKSENGVYFSTDTFEDEMFTIQTRYPKCVFSHETALYLHDLSDRDPLEYSVTLSSDSNRSSIKKFNVKVYSIKNELLNLGIITLPTVFGRKINTYNPERTICDIVRNKSRIEIGIFSGAIKKYITRNNKNIPLLMQYAEKFRIQKKIREYLEVLIWTHHDN